MTNTWVSSQLACVAFLQLWHQTCSPFGTLALCFACSSETLRAGQQLCAMVMFLRRDFDDDAALQATCQPHSAKAKRRRAEVLLPLGPQTHAEADAWVQSSMIGLRDRGVQEFGVDFSVSLQASLEPGGACASERTTLVWVAPRRRYIRWRWLCLWTAAQ